MQQFSIFLELRKLRNFRALLRGYIATRRALGRICNAWLVLPCLPIFAPLDHKITSKHRYARVLDGVKWLIFPRWKLFFQEVLLLNRKIPEIIRKRLRGRGTQQLERANLVRLLRWPRLKTSLAQSSFVYRTRWVHTCRPEVHLYYLKAWFHAGCTEVKTILFLTPVSKAY